MRNFTDDEENKVKQITEMSVNMTYLEPTQTGLSKSIMDATAIVRSYVKDSGLHDFSCQGKGANNKVTIDGYLMTETDVEEVKVTLYRPETKNGDPRIWISRLNHHARNNEIISLIIYRSKIYAFNLSTIDLSRVLGNRNSPLNELLQNISVKENIISKELLEKIIEIVKRGPVKSLVNADTGIGRTLEYYLGISMNSRPTPDYKGIELKSSRGLPRTRHNLFSKVPDWRLSKFKSSAEILNTFGYPRGEEYKLNCTVNAKTFNSQGLKLKINDISELLVETSNRQNIGDFAVWQIEILKKCLLEKHKETFWVKADSQIIEGDEYYSFKSVKHTRKPLDSQMGPLLSQGVITLDHMIKRNKTGKVSERGPEFKINPSSLSILMPDPEEYDLIKLAAISTSNRSPS